jgi:hypothetical protein
MTMSIMLETRGLSYTSFPRNYRSKVQFLIIIVIISIFPLKRSARKETVNVSKVLLGKMSAKVCCANLVPVSTTVVIVLIGMTVAA